MPKRVAVTTLILWVCLIMPFEAMATMGPLLHQPQTAMADPCSHHESDTEQPHQRTCCCTDGDGLCPNRMDAPVQGRTCSHGCAAVMPPAVALESNYVTRARRSSTAFPPVASNTIAPFPSLLLRPPTA